jgi:hypothetical protein
VNDAIIVISTADYDAKRCTLHRHEQGSISAAFRSGKLRSTDIARALREGEPSIGVRGGGRGLEIGVWMMKPGEEKIVAARLRQVLEGTGRTSSER